MSENKNPFCFFWANKGKGFNFLRVEVNPKLFTSVDQIIRHVCNHFEIQGQVEVCFPQKSGKSQNSKMVKLETFNNLKDGRHFALILKGFTEKNCVPAFMVDNGHYQAVERIFSYWDTTLGELAKYQKNNNIKEPIDPLSIFSSNGGILDSEGQFTELFAYLYPIYFEN